MAYSCSYFLCSYTVLEGHAQTINQIARERVEDDARQQNRTLCSIYGQWMVEQLRENLDQVSRGKVLSWISDEQIEHLYRGKRHPNVTNCQLRQLTKVWSNDSCRGTPGVTLGMVLGIPVILKDKVGLRLFEAENIGIIKGGMWMGYQGTLPYVVEKGGKLIGTSLEKCEHRQNGCVSISGV